MDSAKKDGLSCFHCSPPTPLSPGILSDVIHLHHIRHQHLYTYKPFSCSHCDQSFVDHALLASHSILAHGEASKPAEEQYRGSKYLDALCSVMKQCNVYASCKKDSLSLKILQSVKEKSSEVPPENEEIAHPNTNDEFTFRIPAVPQPKMKVPTKEESSTCPLCNRTFLSPMILHIHRQSKCFPVQNKCSSGGKGTKMVKVMKKKVATKKPMLPKLSSMVACRYCMKKFLDASDLKQHRINVHGTNITDAKKQYYCTECKRNFGGKPIVHVAIFHLKQPAVACSKCDYTHWWKVTNVSQHIARVHGNGGAEVIDNRHKFKGELNQLTRKLIKSC